MHTAYWISPILNILAILCIALGLYIAGMFLPSLMIWLDSKVPGDLLSRKFSKIILWLALGALFTSPLLDFVSFIAMLVNMTLAPQSGGEFTYLLGTVSPGIYSSFPLILMILVYGIILYSAREFLSPSPHFNKIGRTFIVLAMASLVYGGINAVFTQVLSFQVPIYSGPNYGTFGYFLEILVGIGLLIVILMGINRVLPGHSAGKH